MTEFIDGYTAQKIKDFWMKTGTTSVIDSHNVCRTIVAELEGRLAESRDNLKIALEENQKIKKAAAHAKILVQALDESIRAISFCMTGAGSERWDRLESANLKNKVALAKFQEAVKGEGK